MSAHTPGPWKAVRLSSGKGYAIEWVKDTPVDLQPSGSCRDIAVINFSRSGAKRGMAVRYYDKPVDHANARVIEKAPEMLAVLDRIIAAWDTGSDPDFTEFDIALREARRVSAAAHGRGIGAVLSEGSR